MAEGVVRPVRSGSGAIGILSNAFGDPYSILIAQGAAQTLARRGFHTISLTGGFPTAPFFTGEDGLVSVPRALDALILVSSTLRGASDELKRLVERSTAPLVSIGAEFGNATNIVADDETGVFQAVAHLVKRHDCKRIAFIAGPEGSVDGARRLASYRGALENFKLAYDPTLSVRGDYEARSGREAVLQLRRRGSRSFDAIVAANDLMAIGAIEGLKAGGIRVPDEVKVVGFDDMEEGAFMSPSLTTVRQPIAEQGVAAAEIAMKRLGGAPIEREAMLISTPLVIRHSCGCGAEDVVRPAAQLSAPEAGDRGLVDDALRGVIRRQLAARRLHRELSRLAEEVIGAAGFPELALAMTGVFRLLNAKRFLLCLYAGSQHKVRVVLESSGREVVFRNESPMFPVGRLLPEGFLRAGQPAQLWLEPLQIADEQFGYFVIEPDQQDGHLQLELRHFLSSALYRIARARELRRLYALEKKQG